MANKSRKVRKNKELKIIIMMVIIFLIVVFMAIKFYRKNISKNEKINLSGEDYYQYFTGIKTEYSGNIELEKNDEECNITLEDGTVINLDSEPIYYKNILGKMLIPKQMALVKPEDGQYKLDAFSNVFYQDNKVYTKKINSSDKDLKEIDKGFLYDGNDLYIFLEDMNLQVGDVKYELSPLSYVIVNYKNDVEIYDYNKDKYTVIGIDGLENDDVIANNLSKSYEINLSVDSLNCQNSKQLLFGNIDELKDYLK